MSFLNQFSSYFSAAEQETELYKVWAQIGLNTEKAILEEQNKLNGEMVDISYFSEDTLRSWLAFFMMKIPYRISAKSQVTVTMNGDFKPTTIPQYSELTTDDGKIYTQMEEINLIKGTTRTFWAVQGQRITETGTYSNMIKIQANNPDMSYISVQVGGKEIPEVSFITSFDSLSYMGSWTPENESGKTMGGTPYLFDEQDTYNKGTWFTVLKDGSAVIGDEEEENTRRFDVREGDVIIYDGHNWVKSFKSNNIRPLQTVNQFGRPSNGYFAYYYNNYLYIKVFDGTEVDDPEGQMYTVSYIQSDGVQGETKSGTLRYVSSFVDTDNNTVELTVSNTDSSTAINEPSVGKLGMYLRQRLYSTITISSIPEYTYWLKAQPEIGDCIVLSDYERWLNAGGQSASGFYLTGVVDIYAIDNQGEIIPPDSEILDELLNRIEPYKDIAFIQFSTPEQVGFAFSFEYASCNNPDSFDQYIRSVVHNYFNVNYLQKINSSLFNGLDLSMVLKEILDNENFTSEGLCIEGYHYKKVMVTQYAFTVTAYGNEQAGGYYLYTYKDTEGNDVTVKFAEQVNNANDSTETAVIVDPIGTIMGSRSGKVISFGITSTYPTTNGTLECFWKPVNPGVVEIGVENGVRQLHTPILINGEGES